MIKIKKAKAFPGYSVWLQFDDGTEGTVDLSNFKGKGIFAFWNQEGSFEKLFIHPESGALAWNEEVEICATALYLKISRKSYKEFFQTYSGIK